MNRRNFIQSKVAGTAILASSGLVCKASAQNPPTVNEKTSMLDVDVLVVGGGSAGHVAAIQAGRLGAKTVLLERNSQLGGTTTRRLCGRDGVLSGVQCGRTILQLRMPPLRGGITNVHVTGGRRS